MEKEFLPWLRGRKQGPNAGVLVPDEPAPGGALAASPSAEPTATDAGNATRLGGLDPASLAGTTRKPLVVRVEFANWSFTYPDDSTWSNLFLGSTGSTVNGYYLEVSPHSFHFAPAAESYGIANDGVVKVPLAYNHPDPYTYTGSANQKIVYVHDALTAANPYNPRQYFLIENRQLAGFDASLAYENIPKRWRQHHL